MNRPRRKPAPARKIRSQQTGPDDRLANLVIKHCTNGWQRPVAVHTRDALNSAQQWLDDTTRPVILDSGCGDGESTRVLAARFPDHAIIGVDRSEVRLSKNGIVPDNCVLVRADLNDLWRLMVDSGIHIAHHYILYPNPYPKPSHLGRRWHGSPVFPSLLGLCPTITLRSNWRIYLEEFTLAVETANTLPQFASKRFNCQIETLECQHPMTAFERKFQVAGQLLYELRVSATS